MPPELAAMMQGGGAPGPQGGPAAKNIPQDVLQEALGMLRQPGEASGPGPFSQLSSPVNLLNSGGVPPTAKSIPTSGQNPRGANRGGKVNTNVPLRQNSNMESELMNRTFNIQR